jgi:Molecular chaperone GrpE (heat shock protein)
MNSKKVRHTEIVTGQTPEDTSETGQVAESKDQLMAEEPSPLEDLQKQLAELQAQADEYKDGWQRSVADFQNYRRRVEAEKAETYQTAVGSIIKRYLPVLDDLQRALAACPADLAWVDGIELICRKLQTILEAEGLNRIEAEGQMFDPHFHEAISQEPSEEHASGQIIAVVQNGYMLGDRVIRPALVRVAK